MDSQTKPDIAENCAKIDTEVQEAIRCDVCAFPFGVREMTPESQVSFGRFLKYVIEEVVPQSAREICEYLLAKSVPDCIACVYQCLEEKPDQKAFRCIFYHHHFGWGQPTRSQMGRFEKGIALLDFEQNFEISLRLAADRTPHMSYSIPTTKVVRNSPIQKHTSILPVCNIGAASDEDQGNNPFQHNVLGEELYDVDGKFQRLLLEGKVKACFDIDGEAVPTEFTIELPEETVIGQGYVFVSENCTIDVLRESVVGQLTMFDCEDQGFEVFQPDGDGSPMTEESFQDFRRRKMSGWKLTVRLKKT